MRFLLEIFWSCVGYWNEWKWNIKIQNDRSNLMIPRNIILITWNEIVYYEVFWLLNKIKTFTRKWKIEKKTIQKTIWLDMKCCIKIKKIMTINFKIY